MNQVKMKVKNQMKTMKIRLSENETDQDDDEREDDDDEHDGGDGEDGDVDGKVDGETKDTKDTKDSQHENASLPLGEAGQEETSPNLKEDNKSQSTSQEQGSRILPHHDGDPSGHTPQGPQGPQPTLEETKTLEANTAGKKRKIDACVISEKALAELQKEAMAHMGAEPLPAKRRRW